MPKSTEASTEDSSVEPSLLYDSSPPISNNPPNKGPAQMYYEQHNRELKILIAMCRGTTDNGGNALFSESERPWKGMKISTYRPSAGHYKSEILRRANLAASEEGDDTPIVLPRPAQWSLTKILRWLDNHPITDPFDRKFLKKALEEFKGDAMLDQSEKLRESDQIEKKWTGKVPYLRLIHALADNDEVKDAFIKRHDIRPDRMAIEYRNRHDKEPSAWELMAEYWNDPSFEPITEELPALHTDFSNSEVLSHEKVAQFSPATPEKCEEKMTSMILQLHRVILNWKRSGQGGGGVDTLDRNDEDSGNVTKKTAFGMFANRTDCALELRRSFVAHNKSYLLYLWHMLEKHDLMRSSMQQLSNNVSATKRGKEIPRVIDAQSGNGECFERKRAKHTTAGEEFQPFSRSIRQHGASMERVAKIEVAQKERSELRALMESLKRERRELSVKLATSIDTSIRNVLVEQVSEINESIQRYETKINALDECNILKSIQE